MSKPKVAPELEINYDKASKFYEPGELVTGTVTVLNHPSYEFKEVIVLSEAYMDTVSAIRGNVGRPPLAADQRIYFMSQKQILNAGGRTTATEPIKFSFENKPTTGAPLIDAYVGVDFSIVYKTTITVKGKAATARDMTGNAQYYCHVPGGGVDPKDGRKYVPHDFLIEPTSMQVSGNQKLPKFKFYGQIGSVNCCFDEPFSGHLICDESEIQIKSIEIQLVRVETFEGKTNATEVQNIQVADGNVIPGLEVPLYMLFPKIYSCPTHIHSKFKIEFHVNLIVIFHNGYQLTENFEIRIFR